MSWTHIKRTAATLRNSMLWALATFLIIAGNRSLAAVPPVAAPAMVTPPIKVSLNAQPTTFTGTCPATIKFAGTISGAAGQNITYYFTRTIKGVVTSLMPRSATLDATGSLDIADSILIDAEHAGSGSDTVTILPQNVSATASFSASCLLANPTHLLLPRIHTWVFEKSGIYNYAGTPDTSRCVGPPSAYWQTTMRIDLLAAFEGEHAYLQEKAAYTSDASLLGFAPEAPGAFCIKWTFTVGHYADEGPSTDFLVTARHINGGPMLCVTSEGSGTLTAGEVAISNAGGPIDTPHACGALPPAPNVGPPY